MSGTDWSRVEFANTMPRSRKAQDFLPVLTNFLVIWDFLSCLVAGECAVVLYFHFACNHPFAFFVAYPFRAELVFGSIITTLILRDPAGILDGILHGPWSLVRRAERRCGMAFAVLILVGLATRTTDDLSRLWLITWLAVLSLFVALTRLACGYYVGRLNGRGELRESVAIIGPIGARERLAARISEEANVVGTFCTRKADQAEFYDDTDLNDLLQLGRDGAVDAVILALEHGQQPELSHIIEKLKSLPIQVAVCREDGWSSETTSQMRLLGGLPMSIVADRPIEQWDLLIKTALDKIVAAVLLAMLMPLMAAIGIAVGLNSQGPIIFRQKRQGWCGHEFTVFKFRTMHDVTGSDCSFQTTRNDRRCTSIGRILRSTSLDELPQLWNVLRGDMSLVGPRPHADSLHDVGYAGNGIVAEYAQRRRVKPGITGWAQIKGARGATATLDQLRRRVELDLHYIENWSIWLDIKILLRTPFCMAGENAF